MYFLQTSSQSFAVSFALKYVNMSHWDVNKCINSNVFCLRFVMSNLSKIVAQWGIYCFN